MTTIRPYDQSLTLANDEVLLVVAPGLGASVLAFDLVADGGSIPLFRRTPDSIESVFDCAMSIMLPWVNRISGGGIHADGMFHPIAPNLPGEPFPNHGNGFQSMWQVASQSATAASLTLSSEGPGPYAYDATYDLSLRGASLVARLEVTNRSSCRLPFGAGFHPWLPRTPDVRVTAFAEQVWLDDHRYIPTEAVDLHSVPDFDFRSGNRLPSRWINNSFVGWDGFAEIAWPEKAMVLRISAPGTHCFHIYSPGDAAPFFCFETETHIPDGANLLRESAMGAPAWLRHNKTLVHEARFEVGRG